MTKQALSRLLLISLTLFCACDKDNDQTNEPEENVPQYQLKSIVWDNGLAGNFVYNNNTLQHIDYTFQSASGRTVFGFNGNTFTEMYDDRSMYKNVFEYDADGKVIKMRTHARTGSSSNGYQFEFRYNSNKKIEELKHYTINEAGKQLKNTSTYYYNGAGDLEKAITQSGNSVITHTIDSYSPPVSYEACHYLDPSLLENYTIYNLAVIMQLQKLHKLPSKVTRVVQTGSDPSYVDKIEEQIFTVDNYRINKVNTSISYPGTGYLNRIEAVYNY